MAPSPRIACTALAWEENLELSEKKPNAGRSPRRGRSRRPVITQRHTKEKALSVVFLAPALLFLLLTNVYPLLYSLRLSFFSWNMTIPLSKPRFVGFENYAALPADPI